MALQIVLPLNCSPFQKRGGGGGCWIRPFIAEEVIQIEPPHSLVFFCLSNFLVVIVSEWKEMTWAVQHHASFLPRTGGLETGRQGLREEGERWRGYLERKRSAPGGI